MKKVFKIGCLALIIIGGIVFGLVKQGVEEGPVNSSFMQQIENQVARDAVKQYEIAKKNGSTVDAYVAAGLVKAAYLQAEDEENYQKWHKIEQDLARQLGL